MMSIQGAYDWLGLDLAILDRCDALIVLTVPGWRTSEGVTREIAAAERAGMPVLYAVAHHGHRCTSSPARPAGTRRGGITGWDLLLWSSGS